MPICEYLLRNNFWDYVRKNGEKNLLVRYAQSGNSYDGKALLVYFITTCI